MATVTNSQGVQLTFVDTSVVLTAVSDIKTAIAGGKTVLCLNDLGDINLGTKSVQEYTCMSSSETFKSLGSISLGNLGPALLYNAADTAGQADLQAMWADGSRRNLIIQLNDEITPTTGNPTYIIFEVAVSSPSVGIAKDAAVTYTPTLEICTVPRFIKAA